MEYRKEEKLKDIGKDVRFGKGQNLFFIESKTNKRNKTAKSIKKVS